MRAIDADKLPVKGWKKRADMLQDDYTTGAETDWALKVAIAENKMLWEIISSIENAPTLTPPNEWVSVEERLPDSQEDVLVVAFWHEHWQTMMGWHSDMGKKWRVITPHGEREPDGVTYWMSLPAPPDCRPPEGEEGS